MRVAKRSSLYERRGDTRDVSLQTRIERLLMRVAKRSTLYERRGDTRDVSLDAHRETPYARREEINSL